MLAVLKSSRMILRAITRIAISTTMRAWMMPVFCFNETSIEMVELQQDTRTVRMRAEDVLQQLLFQERASRAVKSFTSSIATRTTE